MNKPRSGIKSRLISVRVEEDILSEFSSKKINLSYTINLLLRKYVMYIQMYPVETPIIGSSGFNADDFVFDFYSKGLNDILMELV